MKVLISTSSFGKFDRKPIEILEEKGHTVVLNPHGRKISKEELLELADGCGGVVAGTEKYDEDVFSNLQELRVISRVGTGMNSIDMKAAEKHGVMVKNTPDAPTDAVAELTVSLILDCIRKVSLMDREIRKGTWKKRMGNLLRGKTVGIIGLGRIGRRVAELVGPFGVKIVGMDPYPNQEWVKENDIELMELDGLIHKSDIITLHVPYSDDIKGMIGKEEISKMKQSAIIINTSRGGLVDEAALKEALEGGKLGGAALDVMENEPYEGPLRELESVVLTPHIGSYAVEARVRMETEAVQNLLDCLEGKK